jgi:hypothetical protein
LIQYEIENVSKELFIWRRWYFFCFRKCWKRIIRSWYFIILIIP